MRAESVHALNIRIDPANPLVQDLVASELGVPLPTNLRVAGDPSGQHVLWLGPDEWLLVDSGRFDEGVQDRLRKAMESDPLGAVVDVSSGWASIRIVGLGARELLEHGCSLDLHPWSFRAGQCAGTLFARCPVILHCVAHQGEPEYRVLVRPSFAGYVLAWLSDAADIPPGD